MAMARDVLTTFYMPKISALIFDLFCQVYVLGFVSALAIKSILSLSSGSPGTQLHLKSWLVRIKKNIWLICPDLIKNSC